MNPEDRSKIDLLCNNFVSEVDMEKLWPRLFENKIFNRDDVNVSKWQKALTQLETIKSICLAVKTRGPRAFENFILSLRQSNHETVIKKMEHFFDARWVSQRDYSPADDFQDRNSIVQENVVIKVKKATKFQSGQGIYPMRSNPRGLVLIIVNENFDNLPPRTAANKDRENLTWLFTDMGFEVISKKDLTSKGLMNAVKEFARNPKLVEVDSLFVIIASHGHGQKGSQLTEIQGTDRNENSENYSKIYDKDVLDCFSTENCPLLAEKPKIFIFQLCRGQEEQIAQSNFQPNNNGEEKEDEHEPAPLQLNNSGCDNTLMAYATMPGFFSYRDTTCGSWYLQILCKVFMENAHNTHIEDMLAMVDRKLQETRTKTNRCQTSWTLCQGFNKYYYINPGLFLKPEENDTKK